MKKKRETSQRTFRLDLSLIERLDNYTEKTGVPRTFVVTKALQAYLDKNEASVSED